MHKQWFSACIVGAGNIGTGYDSPGSKDILTHAHAIEESEAFRLEAIVDSKQEARALAAEKWKAKTFSSLKDATESTAFDLVIVAVPTEQAPNVLMEVLGNAPKIVLTEKPLANSLDEARGVVSAYAEAGLPLLVNYSRRYLPEIQALKTEIESGTFGDFASGSGYYSRGLLRNGSHLVDLARYLLGTVTRIDSPYRVSAPEKEGVYHADLVFDTASKLRLIGVTDEVSYSVFELDLLFTEARITISDGAANIRIRYPKMSESYSGLAVLGEEQNRKTSYRRAQACVLSEMERLLMKQQQFPSCSSSDALETLSICEQVISS